VTSSGATVTITNNGPASRVLLFVDGTFASPYQTALAQLGYSYQLFTVESEFNQAVATADRINALVVVDATDQVHDLTSVRNFIVGGVHTLVQAFTMISY